MNYLPLNHELFQITEKLAYDHNPHDLFVEMDELRGDEWVEQARYAKTDLQYYINATSLTISAYGPTHPHADVLYGSPPKKHVPEAARH